LVWRHLGLTVNDYPNPGSLQRLGVDLPLREKYAEAKLLAPREATA
jgi:hypothetical protein